MLDQHPTGPATPPRSAGPTRILPQRIRNGGRSRNSLVYEVPAKDKVDGPARTTEKASNAMMADPSQLKPGSA